MTATKVPAPETTGITKAGYWLVSLKSGEVFLAKYATAGTISGATAYTYLGNNPTQESLQLAVVATPGSSSGSDTSMLQNLSRALASVKSTGKPYGLGTTAQSLIQQIGGAVIPFPLGGSAALAGGTTAAESGAEGDAATEGAANDDDEGSSSGAGLNLSTAAKALEGTAAAAFLAAWGPVRILKLIVGLLLLFLALKQITTLGTQGPTNA